MTLAELEASAGRAARRSLVFGLAGTDVLVGPAEAVRRWGVVPVARAVDHGRAWSRQGELVCTPVDAPDPEVPGARFIQRKYALTMGEAEQVARDPELAADIETFRMSCGLPHPQSPIVQGFILQRLAMRQVRAGGEG